MPKGHRRHDLDDAKDEIIRLYQTRGTQKLADKFDTSPHVLLRRLRAWGVPIRRPGKQPFSYVHNCEFKPGDRVRVYGLMNPRREPKGVMTVARVGPMAGGPVMVWLDGVPGAWHPDALELIERGNTP